MAFTRLRAGLIIAEAVICFALPAYALFWGLITAPLWYFAWQRGGEYAGWHLLYAAGGCFGIVAVVAFVRHLVSSDPERTFAAGRNIVFAILGLAALWSSVTDRFATFQLDPFTFAIAVLPSLCFAHFVILALRKSRLTRAGSIQALD